MIRMKVIIVGYGKMGKEVEKICITRNHTVTARIDPFGGDFAELKSETAKQADVAVEFSLPEAVAANAKVYAQAGINAVLGTTGWLERLDEVKSIISKSSIGYLYGSNFSIGAHIFFNLVARATKLINPLPEYDIMGYELHHKMKKDSPSGTAKSIADIILKNSDKKDTLVTDKLDRAIAKNELHFASVRGGSIPGIHTVLLDSDADTIAITHSARSRAGLALGSVMAAEWLAGKKGLFTVDDFVREILG
jgi:4-hydroxy-tetrahydrodipicolinate reductase